MKKIFFLASAAALALGSCSKDMTEDLVPSVSGNSKIIAGYASDDAATRTYTDGKGYFWSMGDALGVFDAAKTSDATNAYYGWSGNSNEFDGDLKMLAGDTYVAYYPWNRGTKIESGKIQKLYINEVQKYNHNEDVQVNGSFAATEAPAVAYGSATEDGKAELAFHPAVSYMRIAFVGQGTVAKMHVKMTDDKNGNKVVPLTGEVIVDLAGLDELGATEQLAAKNITTTQVQGETGEITLDCGQGVDLDKETPTYFWFVIPAAQNFDDKTLTITVYGKEDGEGQDFTREYKGVQTASAVGGVRLVRAQVAGQTTTVPFEWIEGAKDAYLIKSADDFLKYAYVATNGVSTTTEPITPEEMLNEGNTLKSALFTKDIDFADYKTKNRDRDVEYTKFEEAVFLNGYDKTKTIPTIGNYKTKFTINGGNYTLKGLTVEGNGLFCDGYKDSNSHVESKVMNLTLDNVTVDAGEAEKAFFLTNRHYPGQTSPVGITLSNITVNATCKLEAKDAKATALIGRAFTGDIDTKITLAEGLNITYADELNIMNDVDLTTYGENAYNVVKIHENASGAVVTVANDAEVKEFMKVVTNEAKWYSIMDKAGTSYWTGFTADKAAKNADDKIFTAEELAYVVANGGTATLTNTIEIGYDSNWNAVAEKANNAVTIKGENNGIQRVPYCPNGLFGVNATVENLTISGVYAADGLLAKTGTAKNVRALGLNYSNVKADDVKDGKVAGLFYEAALADADKTTKCEVTVQAETLPAGVEFVALYHVVNVDLGHDVVLKADNNIGDYQPFGLLNCYAEDHEDHLNTTQIWYPAGVKAPKATEVVRWNTAGKGVMTAGHTVFLLNKGEDKTTNYVIYDGSLTDATSVNTALQSGNATLGEDITVETYIALSGHVLDGNGKTITNTNTKTTGVYGITGPGEVKNVTTEGGFRAIGGENIDGEFKLTKVTSGKGSAYALNASGANCTLIVTDCTFKGWASWSVKTATFKGCTFNEGDYYDYTKNEEAKKNHWNSPLAVYNTTTFEDCHFDNEMYWILVGRLKAGATITLTNCTMADGTAITAANFETLFKDHILLDDGVKVSDVFKFTAAK